METQTLSAEVREWRGKGPARQLRMRGLIPAIYYGPGIEPKMLQLSPEQLEATLRGDYGRNQIIKLEVGSDSHLAVVRDIAVHPVTQAILHADLYAIAEDRPIETKVPFRTTGRSLGVHKGGVMRKLFRVLPIRALPQDVPPAIVVDVTPLDMGTILKVEDLELPPGVEVTYAPQRRILFVEAKKMVIEEMPEDEAAAAGPVANPAASPDAPGS